MPTSIPLISKNDRALRRNYISTTRTHADFVPVAAISAIGVLLTNRVRRFVSAFSPCVVALAGQWRDTADFDGNPRMLASSMRSDARGAGSARAISHQ